MIVYGDDIHSFIPRCNYVLCKPVLDTNYIQTSQANLMVDVTYKPEHHARVVCEVVYPPLFLQHKRGNDLLMEWETEPNLKIGDLIWVKYITALNCYRITWRTDEGDVQLFLIPYDTVFLAKRGERVIMLNGYVLAERLLERVESTLIIPEKFTERTAVVRYLGQPNKWYATPNDMDDDYLCEGDEVLLAFKNYKLLENPLHRLFSDKDYLVLQRRHIAAVLNRPKAIL
jgi:hypothetical protein